MKAFESACTAAYLKPSTAEQRRGGKASVGIPKIGAPAIVRDGEFGPLFLLLQQADPTDPTTTA